ncbi:MAG: glycosyltransferase family 4 protein [Aggregatilineales bacterium]
MKRVAILHYASPPIVGGVESTIAYHARGLADLGYAVRVISGSGSSFDPRIETTIDPLFGSSAPEVLNVKRELDRGQVTEAFWALVDSIRERLYNALKDCDVCIAHNITSLHKNLALTQALISSGNGNRRRLIAWVHDLAWTNPQYLPELHSGAPWDLLRQPWPNVRYVTVSEARRAELAELLGIPQDHIAVVVPGVDPARFLRWTPTMVMLAERLNLLDADGILLLPARITRRKNIELGIKVLHAMRDLSGRDYRLIVTGPPGPHNPANPGYLGELLKLRQELAVEDSVHFLYAHGEGDQQLIPDDDTMANLFILADALFFPSTQEGFGIPIIEAGLASIPAFCADIPPLRRTGQNDAYYFDPVKGMPRDIAAAIVSTLEVNASHRLRVRVRKHYRWDVLIRTHLVPLVEGK